MHLGNLPFPLITRNKKIGHEHQSPLTPCSKDETLIIIPPPFLHYPHSLLLHCLLLAGKLQAQLPARSPILLPPLNMSNTERQIIQDLLPRLLIAEIRIFGIFTEELDIF